MIKRIAALLIIQLWIPVSYAQAQNQLQQPGPDTQQLDELRLIIERQNRLIEEQSQILQRQSQQLDTFRPANRPIAIERSNQTQNDSFQFSGHSTENSFIQPPIQDESPKPINNGYEGGFTLKGPLDDLTDSGKTKFLMNIGSWGQLRHNFFDSKGPNLDQNDLEFERLRLVFKGHAYNSNFQYFLQLDADADSGAGAQNVDMLDYYGTFDFGNELMSFEKKRLRFRFGRWKIGFNRAREESGTRMQFSDRSTPSVLFDFDRSMAIGLLGEFTPMMGENLSWELNLTNGIDNANFRPSRFGALDRNLGMSTRINWLATGDWGKDGHMDLMFRDVPAIRMGTGFTYTRPDREGLSEFAFPRVVDTGASIATVLPAGVTAYNLFMFAQDFNLKYQGLSIISETYFRQISGFSGGGLPSFSDFGWWFETGYFIVPEKVQLISRYGFIKGDSSTLGLMDTSSDEVAGGFVYYFNKNNSKLTFDITRLNGAPVNDSALSIRPGDAGYLYRTTYQWKF